MQYLVKGLADHAQAPLFKEYVGLSKGGITTPSWSSITYEAFRYDLEASARYLQEHLKVFGVKAGDTVGVWITGQRYEDLVHLYAVARAGYVPQVFNLVMTTQGGTMINELISLRSGKALVYDPYFEEHVHKITVPTFFIPDLQTLASSHGQGPLSDIPQAEDDDVAIIFHTSGTTSGRPKPVPQSHKWLRFQSELNWPSAWQVEGQSQKCFNNVGSFAAVASAT
ncbi:hypothetical protein H0H87_012937, partial [Tephrocybe sp. NHM501043]